MSLRGDDWIRPAVRFENHKRGYKANSMFKSTDCICCLSYEYYNPMSYEVAAAKEKSLAEELRAEGMPSGGIDGQSCPDW